jgi:transcriptional activator of cad operon
MDSLVTTPIRVGAWHVDPLLGQLSKGEEVVKVEARTMRLLVYLAHRAGEVVSVDELLTQVWAGVVVTPDSVYQSVASLRRLLGDDPRQPRYIATVPRMGYRMIADVALCADAAVAEPSKPQAAGFRRPVLIAVACMVLVVTGAAYAYWAHTHAGSERAAIAVLPFLDLTTQEMNEEFFADGLTEELIGDLSKIPTFRIPSPTASFFYKGKQLPVAGIARELGVDFILDGSVRKSGNTYRVATRLVRADDGFVVWSMTFDRPLGDLVQIQKDIAVEATKAVRSSLEQASSKPAAKPGALRSRASDQTIMEANTLYTPAGKS